MDYRTNMVRLFLLLLLSNTCSQFVLSFLRITFFYVRTISHFLLFGARILSYGGWFLFQSCALKVDTQSGGWEKYLTKMLKKIKGINSCDLNKFIFTMHASIHVLIFDIGHFLFDLSDLGKNLFHISYKMTDRFNKTMHA